MTASCGVPQNSIEVKTAREAAAANCDETGKCVKDPNGLVLYNTDLVTENFILKRNAPETFLASLMNLIDEPKLLVTSDKIEPHLRGVAFVKESEPCDSPKGIDGTNPTAGKLRLLKEGRYKACIAYIGEGIFKKTYALEPIEVDTTPPQSAGSVTVSNVAFDAGIISWMKSGDNITLDGDLSYTVYLSKTQALSSLASVRMYGNPQPGKISGATSYALTDLSEKTEYHAAVVVSDEAGNESLVGSANFATPPADAVAPSVTISSDRDPGPTNIQNLTLTIKFSENVTGFDASRVNLTGASKGGFTTVDQSTYTLAVTANASYVTAVVPAASVKDLAGNDSTASNTWSLNINGATASPVAIPAAGIYTSAQAVSLASSTPGATIYYTLDGSAPSTASTIYSAPIFVGVSQIIKALSVAPNYNDSAVESFDYTITGTVQAPTFSVASGAYGPAQTVALSSATPGAVIYYTTDNSAPTTSSNLYTNPVVVSSTQTLKAFAVLNNWLDSTVSSASYTINGAVAAPTFSVSAGAYGAAQLVSLSTATFGATIYYTIDGSTPSTSSSVYSSAISVSSSMTLKAFATKADFSDSAVVSAEYTINGSAAAPIVDPVTGTYITAQSVSLTSATSGASIYYTLDGSAPTTSSLLYSSPFLVGVTQTIKAIAVKSTFLDSSVGSFAYTITGTVQAPTFSVPEGSYGPVQSVALSSLTPGASIYYTTDGSSPSVSSNLYTSPITVSSSQTIKAYAVLDAWADSSVSTASYTINGKASAPTFSVAAGAYGPAQSVVLSTATVGAAIYYTTDGSAPSTSSSVYSSAINVTSSMTLKAIAVKSDFIDSDVATAIYTINGAVAAPTFSVAAGAYGPAQNVALSTVTPGATIYYTTDGSTPTVSSSVYTSAINVTSSATIKAFATKADFVNSSVATALYTINGAVAMPTFSVAAGAYGPAQSVVLSTATTGATIYYTTDGAAPTTASPVYSSAITVSSSMTVKAFATKAEFSDSQVATASYTINGAVAAPTFSVAAGAYGLAQAVALSSTTPGAVIYYTTDGSTPDASSSSYVAPIVVSTSSTIKAVAVKPNFSDSALASASYIINGTLAAPTASPLPGVYTTAQSITLSSAASGSSIYYTVDGSTPSTTSTLYTTPVFVGVSQTLKAIAVKPTFADSSVASFAYTITGTVQAPAFSVASGAYGPSQNVALSSATPGATIYYTTDGNVPTSSSTQYTGPITVSSSQTIKAYAVLNNWADSAISSATYTINGAASAPTFSVAAGAYGGAQTVALDSSTLGAAIYYTTDGSSPTTSSNVYTTPISVASSLTIKAFVVKSTYSDSAVASASYTINGAAAAPTFSVSAGAYGPAQTVSLSSLTSGASIYYTTDGSTPTISSSLYSSPINVAASMTIKAFAVKADFLDSAVAQSSYTINGAVATPTFSVAAGAYGAAQSVAISTVTSGATIYFTTDGSMPTTSSSIYTAPINVPVTTTIKTIAVKATFSDSSVASATYTINGAAAIPVASPVSGNYTSAQSVTLSSATSGASIYYTVDGSTPTTSSTAYTGPIFVGVTQTIKAIATKATFSDSGVGTFIYSITGTVQAPTFGVAAGAYGPGQTVSLSSSTPGATIYYTIDGSTPTTSSNQYSSPISVATSQTIKAYAVLTNWADSAVSTASYTINGPAATPTFSVAAGAYGPAQSVVLSTATAGATIYYTTDGSSPTTASTQYSGAINVSNSMTIKAFAAKATFSDSAMASATYTINGAVATPTFSVAAGAYGPAQSVVLSSVTPGATIYYTTDGSTPTTASSQYSGAINVSNSMTIKAFATKVTFSDSAMSSATYTINGAVATPTFSVAAGAYGPAQSVVLSAATSGATIYYTTDGSTPTTASTQYLGAINVSSSMTIKAFATKATFSDSGMVSATYTINGSVATPTFSVAAGAYGPAQSVVLSTATSGATIYYTTDGSTPTTASTQYSAAISVSSSLTIKAFATKTTFSDSALATAAYTINGAASAPTASPVAGIYTTAQSVTLTSPTTGANIYYTVDGSTPTTSSTLYASPILVAVSQTIKAIATKASYSDSSMASFVYTVTGTVQAPTFSVAEGAYGPAQTVSLSSATPGATIYYTTNGSAPTTASTQYTSPITVSTSQTLKAYAVLTNWTDSSVTSATFTINGAVSTPTFSVAAGAYGSAQTVAMGTSTTGATIYYTTDGSSPTTASSIYSTPLVIPVTSTIKAYAVKATFSDSAVASATYTINGAVATPSASPVSGPYTSAQSVTLTSATSGASIYYTVDGSTPTASSTAYTGPIFVGVTQTIKAIATKAEFSDSGVGSFIYSITGTVQAPTFSVAAGAYGPAQTVSLSSATPGAAIYYTTNGSDPTTTSTQYSGPITVSTSQTIKAFAVLTSWADSSVSTAAYTINGAVATPTFSVAAGAYGPAQSVVLSTATSGATIYYTTDGTTPTTASNVYSTAINVSSSMTLKAFATKSTYSDSAVASATYTINGAVAAPTASPVAGTYTTAQSVSLSSATAGASIYYTLDGSTPTTASTLYSTSIFVGVTQTIKAIAVMTAYTNSSVASFAYTITGTVQAPTFSVAAGAYGPAQTVTLSSATPGATIYYTTNGMTPTTSSTVYTTAITVSSTQTINAYAVLTNWADSSVSTAAYTINGAAAAPTASLVAGEYTTSQSVTLSSTSVGATIYYTTDGSTPTTSSTQYSSAISVNTSTTIKAIAGGSAYISSSVASFAYSFNPSNLTAVGASTTSITLSWTASPGAVTYKIAYATGATAPATCNTGTQIAGTTVGNVTTYTVGSLTANTQYSFRVCSNELSGNMTTGVTVSGYPAAPNPTNFALSSFKATSAALSWTSGGTGTAGYQISYATGTNPPADCNTGTVISAGTIGGLVSYTVNYLTGGTQYAFRLCATNLSGNLSSGVTGSVTTAQSIITTVAGTGYVELNPGTPVTATTRELNHATYIASDSSGNIYICDSWNNIVKKVTTSGLITTIAGTGAASSAGDGGAATNASLMYPTGIAIDSSGNIYIAESVNIRKITVSTGLISKFAGGTYGNSGDGGPATSAAFTSPAGLSFDAAGNLYITDAGSHVIRKVDTSGNISTVAGTGSAGYTGNSGAATSATLNSPQHAVMDSSSNLYIADTGNNVVRKVNSSGVISTIAGTGSSGSTGDGGLATSAKFNYPSSLALDALGNLYVTDQYNSTVRKIVLSSGVISRTAGQIGLSGTTGDGGLATSAKFWHPRALATDGSNNLYVSDSYGLKIRKVTVSTGNISTIAGTGSVAQEGLNGQATASPLSSPSGVAVDSLGNMYISNNRLHQVRKVDTTGKITILAGAGTACGTCAQDGTAAASAWLGAPSGLAVDQSGNVYIADNGASKIRKVTASTGIISTVAGTGTSGYSGDGGVATSAQISAINAITIDATGNIYFADFSNHRIRKINTSGVISTIAGTGTMGNAGNGGSATSATISYPNGIAVDSAGNVYFSQIYNHNVRRIDTGGIITVVAGTGAAGFSGDGGSAILAELSYPQSLFVDGSGNLYISDMVNRRIRKVDSAGIISTIAGTGAAGSTGDGGAATSATIDIWSGIWSGIWVDSSENVYFADINNHKIRKISNVVNTDSASNATVYGGTLNLANGSNNVNFPNIISYSLAANEIKWFKVNYTGCSAAEDDITFTTVSTGSGTGQFTGYVYDRNASWIQAAGPVGGSYGYSVNSANTQFYANMTSNTLIGSACDSVATNSNNAASFNYIRLVNGATPQKINVTWDSIGY
jgi:sugar lactone lactonase YvrE